ncbi:MAG: tetratricopeptide repeat protein, partial [Gemmataceae bacterium]|nr:tetratricopeptide repeat protein [Gemmataceae bacterium]
PFTAESPMETVLLLFQTEPVSPSRLQPKIPRDLETICLKCLQKAPHRRYASAEELANDLQRFLLGEPILARPALLHEKVWKWMRRRPALATLAACSALAAVSLLGLIVWYQVDLQTRLQQALNDERETRTAQEANSERERLGQLRGRLEDLVQAGERALATRDWHTAHLQLTRARDQVAGEPELADWQRRIEQLLGQSQQQRLDHERLDTFLRRRNEALFQATLFTLDDLASAVQETRAAALEALTLVGVRLDSTTGPAVDSTYYTERQKAEIVTACYELLVVLADAVAQPLPEHRDADQRRRAEEALRVLDRAANLGVTTQAYHRRRAYYLEQAGQSEAANQERQQATALHPATALDHFLLGQEQYRRGAHDEAIRAFENVLQAEPQHFWASYYLALCWLKTQRPARATAYLTSGLVQRGDFPWLYLLRALAWGEQGQFDRAEADYEAALQASLPDAARYGLLINRGVLRIRTGHLDSAMADLRQAVALRPQQYQGYLNLAQAYLKGDQINEALAQLDQAIHREPKLASLYRTRSRVHLMRQDQVAALADLDRVLALEAAAARPILAEDYLERGRLLYSQKDYAGALEAYDAALRIRRNDPRACRYRAEALLGLHRLPEALQSLDDCLKYGPRDPGVFRARAALRTRLGQYPGAQTDYTRALEKEPDAATYAARGWCYLVADAPRLALPDFEEALRRAPEQADAYAGRGYSRVLLGETRLALADAEEALRRGPPAPRLYYNIARIYAQAIATLDSEPARHRSTAVDLRSRWQDRALQLLTKALHVQSPPEAARFWQNVIAMDKALNPIRRSPEFRQLAARYPPRQDRTAAAPVVHRED